MNTDIKDHQHHRTGDVWFCIPSARPLAEVKPIVSAWHDMGYRVALWRDESDADTHFAGADKVMNYGGQYPGYARAVNFMARNILESLPFVDWIVTGGDDTLPDPRLRADQIAAECSEHFQELWMQRASDDSYHKQWPFYVTMRTAGSFGVMQPTGDPFANYSIKKICGSPWLGREWCLRGNSGMGPFYPGFVHMFGDECLQRTTQALGILWQRPDLIHRHNHFMREGDNATRSEVPPHLKRWNEKTHWNEAKALFQRLESQGFQECMPL